MKREPVAELALPGRVVHVVGRMTDEVASFLGPAAHTLARSGHRQSIVMIDDPAWRHTLVRLPDSAQLVSAPVQRNPLKQWAALRHACAAAIEEGQVHAVHLHGLMPGLVGARALRSAGVDAPLFFSPHGSRLLGSLSGVGRFLRALIGAARSKAIVNVAHESSAFEHWSSSELVESPVGDVFFEVPRNEARHPLIVTGGYSQSLRNTELFCQLAVLLSGEDLRISFNWIGEVDDISRARLNAAGVGVFKADGDAELAARLAAGWIYLAPAPARGFPLFLVEAMAAGLPCVALDCIHHREVIEDGKTGYLCTTEREMIERIALLIDDTPLRLQMGQAARATARGRFGESQFGIKLMAAYARS